MTPSDIIALLMLIAFIVFGILTHRQNKKIGKSSTNIIFFLNDPTTENINKAKEEAQSISMSTASPLALAFRSQVENEIRAKAVRGETPRLDEVIKEQEKTKEWEKK